jgi:putative ABC transport system permease protein
VSPLVRSGLRFHLRRPMQLALSVLGVALGVAVVAAMHLAIESARRGFDLSNEAVFGRVTHTLEAGPAGIDETLYPRLRVNVPEVPAAPVVQGMLRFDGKHEAVTLLGVDPFAEAAFRSHSPGVGGGSGLSELLTRPGTVLASRTTAARLGLAPGESFTVRAAGREVSLHLLGHLPTANELEAAGLEQVLVADIATAQEVLGRVGRVGRIDLAVPGGGAEAETLDRIRRLLPRGVRMEAGAARARVREQMTRAFYLNLKMLSALALVVGLFIIYNAMTFAVVQRRTLIGTLRAVGVSGREVLIMVLLEAACLGAAASAVGLPVGIALARRLVVLVTRSIDDLYFHAAVRDFSVSLESLLLPVLLGVLGSVLAALGPALEATRIPPRAALTASHLEQGARRAVPVLGGFGVCAALASCVLLAGGGRSLPAAFLALFALVAAAVAATPAATIGASRLLEKVVRVRASSVGAMAVRGLRSGLSRNAVAVAALMVALATTVGVAVMVASFRASLQDWLAVTLASDVYVALPGREAGTGLPPAVIRGAASLPGVREVSLSRDVDVATQFGEVWLKAVSEGAARYRGLHLLGERSAEAVWRSLAREDSVLASEPFAWRHGLRPGDRVLVYSDAGPRALQVAAVFRDYSSDRGMLLMGITAYRSLFRDRGVSALGLMLDPGTDTRQVTRALGALAGNGQELRIRSQAWIREASLEIFERTFAITRVLQWLATLVACVGVLSALMALVLERAREMAVLRAQGLTRGELWLMLQIQTASMGLIAGVLALPLGALMALVLVHVINRRAFGWGMEFHLPPEALVQTMLVALASALLAGLYPAWRMAATSPARALRQV